METVIYHTIEQITGFSTSEISELLALGAVKKYRPKTCFIKAGQVPTTFGIVINGLFRYVYISEQGKELTKAFMAEKSFISSYSAMKSGSRSHFYIEALEPSSVFTIPYNDWEKLRAQNPSWNLLLIKLLEKGYSVKEKREREFLLLDAESRYRIFLEEYPDLEKRVKQHMIASYLGITPIALSRIRKKMKLINLG